MKTYQTYLGADQARETLKQAQEEYYTLSPTERTMVTAELTRLAFLDVPADKVLQRWLGYQEGMEESILNDMDRADV